MTPPNSTRRSFIVAIITGIGALLAGLVWWRNSNAAPAEPTATATPTSTDTPTSTPTSTSEPPTATSSPTSTDTPSPTPTATRTPIPATRPPTLTPTPNNQTVQQFPVYNCSDLGDGTFQWYSADVTYQEGVPIKETITGGPFTGPWQPGCPEPQGGDKGGKGGGGGGSVGGTVGGSGL